MLQSLLYKSWPQAAFISCPNLYLSVTDMPDFARIDLNKPIFSFDGALRAPLPLNGIKFTKHKRPLRISASSLAASGDSLNLSINTYSNITLRLVWAIYFFAASITASTGYFSFTGINLDLSSLFGALNEIARFTCRFSFESFSIF